LGEFVSTQFLLDNEEFGFLLLNNILLNVEVVTLVLLNPLTNLLDLDLSGSGKRLWVSLIGESQIQVVSGVLNVEESGLLTHVEGNTTSLPGVELTVGENDVGSLHEILLGVQTTEVIKGPVVLRSLVVSFLAVCSVGRFVPS